MFFFTPGLGPFIPELLLIGGVERNPGPHPPGPTGNVSQPEDGTDSFSSEPNEVFNKLLVVMKERTNERNSPDNVFEAMLEKLQSKNKKQKMEGYEESDIFEEISPYKKKVESYPVRVDRSEKWGMASKELTLERLEESESSSRIVPEELHAYETSEVGSKEVLEGVIAHKEWIDDPTLSKTTSKQGSTSDNSNSCISPCSSDCESKKCFSLSSDLIERVCAKLRSMKKSELHNYLLSRIRIQSEMVIRGDKFVLEKHSFCKKSVVDLLGISEYLVTLVLKESKEGKTIHQHKNLGSKYYSPMKDQAVAFIEQFATVHAENLPDRSVLKMPKYMSIRLIYNYYCENTQMSEQVSEKAFYRIFQDNFAAPNRENPSLPRIVFMSNNSHPVCTDCTRIDDSRKKAKLEQDLKHAERLMREHLLEIRRKYIKFENRKELARRFPLTYLHIGNLITIIYCVFSF